MPLPTITGQIERRVLLNYRAEPTSVQKLLPSGMRARVINGYALVGVCMIRFAQLRPQGLPTWVGMGSENAAFRISVDWDEDDARHTGVYVLQRVTNHPLIRVLGGRLFPGVHQRARFECHETDDSVAIDIEIPSQQPVRVHGQTSTTWSSQVFSSHEDASAYFSQDTIGYSPKRCGATCEGLRLDCLEWATQPLATTINEAGFWTEQLPGCVYDHSLIMHRIPHRWHSVNDYATSA